MPASIGYPVADGGAVEFYISGGGGYSFFQRGLHLSPPSRQPRTSWHNGKSPKELLQKRRKQLRMKGHSVSLGIDVSCGDCLIAALTGRLVNAH